MIQVLLIGIGAGDPCQITYEAVEALRCVDVFFVMDKGPEVQDLLGLRKAILQRYLPDGSYRIVQVTDPPRVRQTSGYAESVDVWHRQRAAAYATLLQTELQPGQTGAFLLWGEPGLYDSTLRVMQRVRERGVSLALKVVPGISSMQLLAARHQIALTRVGEPLIVLPGRRLVNLGRIDNVVVMLDSCCAFTELSDPALTIFWGAYLGTADEMLIAGPLEAVKARIVEVRASLRRRKGWMMDIYLLRREVLPTSACPTEPASPLSGHPG
ncbi:precorrin-6A synthase (deacetylating) [Pseudomonas fulva]|uniref:precorrin-6A synthase (deacetylating) n=1 Tax=Pseudomonas fulva TaxID=47880 RepID=UPI0018A912AC|nr:precorrin-6A synthase (deacetylating) [Pseudomonas fulva]MBF8675770.1 precorrin-6A synthase (deacetylating) [Pseudomonas fulva]MBF8697841.1 precorrin-6A synthase (deacetylating) [Pseudomonas fulva]